MISLIKRLHLFLIYILNENIITPMQTPISTYYQMPVDQYKNARCDGKWPFHTDLQQWYKSTIKILHSLALSSSNNDGNSPCTLHGHLQTPHTTHQQKQQATHTYLPTNLWLQEPTSLPNDRGILYSGRPRRCPVSQVKQAAKSPEYWMPRPLYRPYFCAPSPPKDQMMPNYSHLNILTSAQLTAPIPDTTTGTTSATQQ
jgi:hypothetical protein